MTYGYIIIEKPEGAAIYVDGVQVGTVLAPIADKGSITIDSAPRGAKIYIKKTAGYVYHGLTPQTLSLAAGPVPYIIKIEKDGYGLTYDLVYIVPDSSLSKTYHLERVVSVEPTVEPTATVTVRGTPSGELWMYMEGAEGFVSYGMTPQTLTLKATRGMWVAMEEAKTARAEGRVSAEEATRLDAEIAKRAEEIRLAKVAYDEAKIAREEAEALLSTFRSIYNEFLTAYNSFLSRYSAFTTTYNNLIASITHLQTQYNAASEGDKPIIAEQLAAAQAQKNALEAEKTAIEAEKAAWDADLSYWSDMLMYYEENLKLLREYEHQMRDEWEEAKVRALAPYWMVTPGLLGTTWRLKITKAGFQDVIDRFTLEPGQNYTKDYALAAAVDVTTPESLAPLVLNTPPPTPPAVPISHAWLFITVWGGHAERVWYDGKAPPVDGSKWFKWQRKNWTNLGPTICEGDVIAARKLERKGLDATHLHCEHKFLKIPPGKHTYYILPSKGGGRARFGNIIRKTLYIAPGETRYVSMDLVATENTEWSNCPFGGGVTPGEAAAAAGTSLCGKPAGRTSFGTGGVGSTP